MGRIAALHADRIVVTSDNPRSEDPAAIAQAVVAGIRETDNRKWSIELDRASAVERAVADARWGDVVLVAGKGHEDYQECAGARVPYSDGGTVVSALARWSAR
jgi:UDP-N-acetylmuramoyl-L-alanyl-D-glutamate--2,6-diaminopimelate ligase